MHWSHCKKSGIWQFWTFFCPKRHTNFTFFKNSSLKQVLVFFVLWSVHQNPENLKKKILFFSTIRGDPFWLRGVKKNSPHGKKRLKTFFFSININLGGKWNKKMVGRSCVITCGEMGTLYVAVCQVGWYAKIKPRKTKTTKEKQRNT